MRFACLPTIALAWVVLPAALGCATTQTTPTWTANTNVDTNDDAVVSVRIALGSCADESEGTERTFNAIIQAAPDALVLLGDTPYIDSTDPRPPTPTLRPIRRSARLRRRPRRHAYLRHLG